MYILEIRCRGSTVAELSKLTYVEDFIIISPLFLCRSLNFPQKAMVQYTIFKTVLLYLLKVYPSLGASARNLGTFLAIIGTFSRKSSEINIKNEKTSILFTVTRNISALHTGSHLL